MGRQTGWGRSLGIAAFVLCLVPVGCQQPNVGVLAADAPPSQGPHIVLQDGWVDLHGHVVATFSVTQDGAPLSLDEVNTLGPRFTLATLSPHPVDGQPEWRSEILTGSETAAQLPPSGPGTPPALVLTNVRQPGAETPTTLFDLGGGTYRYVFANSLSAFDPDQTVRIGMWLQRATAPSLLTSSTFDFRPSGGPMETRDLITDAACNGCHANLVMHSSRTRVKLCLTCHTWQNTDPQTVDPASLTTTASTYPNPLEFGRMVHRIHRGTNLPTLYQSSSQAVPAPALAAGSTLPLPFSPSNNTTAVLGQKYSIVGARSSQFVPGMVIQRTSGQLGPLVSVVGIHFPRDLRDCGVCHAVPDANGVPRQAYQVTNAISRRICAGCHPDTWFDVAPITDLVHFAHPGGPQAGDGLCVNCHVQASAGYKLYAPIAIAHLTTEESPRYTAPQMQIVSVANLQPGKQPQVTYRIFDRDGPVAPTPANPVPMWEPESASSSFIARKFTSLTIRIYGPTSPEYPDYGEAPKSVAISSGASQPSGDPLQLTTEAGTDEYVYTFSTISPNAPPGTYAVGMEGRRQPKPPWPAYRPDLDVFLPPYTGETVTESPDNPIVYVDSATGAWPPDGPAPRREVVSEANCLRCHGRLELHGSVRHQVQYCVFCHNPTATDWPGRPKVGGSVSLPLTWDGIEERSVHFKVMIHRIHTGARTGASSLEAIQPFLVYHGSPGFFDDVIFPGNLASCPTCHTGKTYLVDHVPAGVQATIANETATVIHTSGTDTPVAGELTTPPITAACQACHETGTTFAHTASYTKNGVESCASCHVTGSNAVDVVHGLVPAVGTAASASFSSIVQNILVPSCATSGCHASGGTPPVLDAASAYNGLVNAKSAESSMVLVTPGSTDQSYLVYKLLGDVASAGGTGSMMPPQGSLAPADIAAIEAWIQNGAPND